MSREPVELVVNCFERSYRQVLSTGFFPGIAQQNHFHFARRVVLINNVADRERARRLAEELRRRGEIDTFLWVDEHRDDALRAIGLSFAELGRIHYYSDFAFVAILQARCPWLVCWDAEAILEKPADWISPSLELLGDDPRLLVANPRWDDPGQEREWAAVRGPFALGYGFSDQLFLARVSDLARPIYQCHALASLRYPTAHIARTFEQRVDSYMRSFRRPRATFLGARYLHPRRGDQAYAPHGVAERLRRRRNRLLLRYLRSSRSENPCRRIYWDTPEP